MDGQQTGSGEQLQTPSVSHDDVLKSHSVTDDKDDIVQTCRLRCLTAICCCVKRSTVTLL